MIVNVKHPNLLGYLNEYYGNEAKAYKIYLLFLRSISQEELDELDLLEALDDEAIEEIETVTYRVDCYKEYYDTIYEIDNERYLIFSYDEARERAFREVIRLIECEGYELLNEDYRDYILYNSNLLNDDVVERIAWKYLWDEIEAFDIDEINDYLEYELDEEELDAMSDDEKYEAFEDVKKEQLKELGYLDYIREAYINDDNALFEMLEEEGALDIDDVAWDMIITDGAEHFLATYDGAEIELDAKNDIYAYRID